MDDLAYIKVRFDFEKFSSDLVESLAVLPGIITMESMYPDDPALSNIYLAVTSLEYVSGLLDTISSFEPVEFSEVIDKPEIRK